MEGFSYHDIFATKGIEYLVVIAFLALLVPISLVLNQRLKITRRIRETLGVLTAGMLKVPQGIFYGRNHTWMFMEKSGEARVGLDDLLLHLTGEVTLAGLRSPGEAISKGDLLAEIRQNDRTLRIYSPVSGHILRANPVLGENPGVLNEDPYGRGWIYKIRPTNWMAEARSCYLAAEASEWSARELVRFKDLVANPVRSYAPGAAMTVLQDGGEICDHTLSKMPEEAWEGFQKEFLNLYQV